MKIENTMVYNFSGAFRGLRNPLNSWDRSDSDCEANMFDVAETDGGAGYCEIVEDTHLGPDDIALAQRMLRGGNDEAKFMRQIFVSMDITSDLSWWKQMDQYKVGTVTNSCSTMHRLATTPINMDCFNFSPTGDQTADTFMLDHIRHCEQVRQAYLNTRDMKYWHLLVQMLPNSWLQKRTWTGNYAVLRNIYFARRGHKLADWHKMCEHIESLPYAKELICYEIK